MTMRVLLEAEVEFAEAAERYESESLGGGERLVAISEALFTEIEEHPQRYPYYGADDK